MKIFCLAVAGWLIPGCLFAARPLTESTFTQVINDVKVLAEASKTPTPAKVNDLFKTPDLLRTGADSLAELKAADQTITRVGANTVFSFEANGRNINLEQGSVLFHSPKGKGGGTIKTRAASAAVLGTTIIVVATVNGGFKAIVLEGRGQVRLPNGNFRILQAGQLVFILPGAVQFGPVLNINLGNLIKSSRLVKGFQSELPSTGKIAGAVRTQERLIEKGEAEDTGLLVGGYATKDDVAVVEKIESGVQEQLNDDKLEGDALDLPAAVKAAASTDALIDTSLLDSSRVFTAPFTFQHGSSTITSAGFVANNISITTPTIDLTQYTSGTTTPYFDILAFGQLSLLNSLTLFGSITNPAVAFETRIGGINGVTIQPGSMVTASCVGDFAIASGTSVSFSDVFIKNATADRRLEINLIADSTGEAFGDVTLSGVQLGATQVEVRARDVNIFSSSTIDLLNGAALAPQASLHAENNLTVDGLQIFGPSGFKARFEADQSADLNNVYLSGVSELTISGANVTLSNTTVNDGEFDLDTVELKATSDLTLDNTDFSGTGSGDVKLIADGNLAILGSQVDSVDTIDVKGQNINVQNSFFRAQSIAFDAADNLTVDTSSFLDGQMVKMVSVNGLTVNNTQFSGGTGSTLVLQAGNLLNANNVQLSGLASLSMQADTIVLQNIDFPSGLTVDMRPAGHAMAPNANTGQPVVPHLLNAVSGVSIGGVPIPSDLGAFTGTISGTSFTVH